MAHKEMVSKSLDCIELDMIRKNNKLNIYQENELAKEVKREAWEHIQKMVEVKLAIT